MNRRQALLFSSLGIFSALPFISTGTKAMKKEKKKLQLSMHPEVIEPFELDKLDWKARLEPDAYYVLREAGTERPFTSSLNDEKRAGEFACAGCNLVLFSSEHKFDSGTGWPSFWQAIDGRIGTSTDYKLILPRTEYHCARCGGHHGHVFNDGPKPTGKRYCNNGVALKFIPAKA